MNDYSESNKDIKTNVTKEQLNNWYLNEYGPTFFEGLKQMKNMSEVEVRFCHSTQENAIYEDELERPLYRFRTQDKSVIAFWIGLCAEYAEISMGNQNIPFIGEHVYFVNFNRKIDKVAYNGYFAKFGEGETDERRIKMSIKHSFYEDYLKEFSHTTIGMSSEGYANVKLIAVNFKGIKKWI